MVISSKTVFKYSFIALIFSSLVFGPGLSLPVNTGEDKINKKEVIDSSGIGVLLSRLDLNITGLEKVKASVTDPLVAAVELLKYYRSRESIKHPVDRRSKTNMFGKCASENDIKVADDALQHIFIGQSAYPPYFYGDDINWGSRPVPDNEWVWQLNRMYFWQSMALAYWHTNDEKYARE